VSCNELALDVAAFIAAAAAPRPLMVVIGETAADALTAFEARALDFVPRPIDGARLQRAVDRAREWIDHSRLQRLLVGVAAGLEPTPSAATSPEPLLRLRVKGQIVVVRPSEIELIEACGNYVRVVTTTRQYLHQGTMKQCLAALHPYGFVRAHRRVIVNSQLVRGSAPGGQLQLQSGRWVRCGRLYRHLLHRRVRGFVRRGASA
jgi:two-component system LytT family response regulator